MDMSSARFAEFVSDLQYSRIPSEVTEKAKQCVLDSVGVAINGALTESGRIISGVARDQFAKGSGSVAVWGDRLSATGCAFANSSMAMYLSMDDIDRLALSHFGSSVIWAALAAGAEAGANGKRVIEAVVGGYEVAARLGALLDPPLRKRGIRTTALVNSLAGAAAAGKAMGLDRERLTNAINLAATCS